MDCSSCFWSIYLEEKPLLKEGWYCSFDVNSITPCNESGVCMRYISENAVPDFIRHLIKEYKEMEKLLTKLP